MQWFRMWDFIHIGQDNLTDMLQKTFFFYQNCHSINGWRKRSWQLIYLLIRRSSHPALRKMLLISTTYYITKNVQYNIYTYIPMKIKMHCVNTGLMGEHSSRISEIVLSDHSFDSYPSKHYSHPLFYHYWSTFVPLYTIHKLVSLMLTNAKSPLVSIIPQRRF